MIALEKMHVDKVPLVRGDAIPAKYINHTCIESENDDETFSFDLGCVDDCEDELVDGSLYVRPPTDTWTDDRAFYSSVSAYLKDILSMIEGNRDAQKEFLKRMKDNTTWAMEQEQRFRKVPPSSQDSMLVSSKPPTSKTRNHNRLKRSHEQRNDCNSVKGYKKRKACTQSELQNTLERSDVRTKGNY